MKRLIPLFFFLTCFSLITAERSFGAVEACITVNAPYTISAKTVFMCKGEWINIIGSNCLGNTTPAQEEYTWTRLYTTDPDRNNQNFTTQDSGRYVLTLKNLSDGTTDKDTLWVRYYNTPNFYINGNALGVGKCKDQSLTLVATTGAGISGHKWYIDTDPGTILSSTTSLLVTTIPGDTSAYYVANAQYTGGGYNCTLRDTIYATTFPNPQPFLGNDTALCVGQTLILKDTQTIGIYQYSWNGSPFGTTQTYPVTTTGNYSLTMKGPNPFSCVATDQIQVTFNPNPILNVGPATTICNGASINLNVTVSGATGPFKFAWTPKSALNDSTLQSPLGTPAITTTYTVLVTVDDNTSKCKTSTSKTVTVNPAVSINSSFADSTTCGSDAIQLQAIVSGGTAPYTYTWSPTTAMVNETTATPTVNPSSSINYTVDVKDAYLCTAPGQTINVDKLQVELGGPDTLALIGDSVLLEAYHISHPGFSYTWTDSVGNIVGTGKDLKVKTPNKYTITVYNSVTNCSVTDMMEVIFTNEIIQDIFIPNVFNPTYTDPENSHLRVYGNNVSEENFVFQVFNNWGEMIYESFSYDEANQNGWNGKFKNSGQTMNIGVYTYSVRGQFYDGTKFEKTGTANLIR